MRKSAWKRWSGNSGPLHSKTSYFSSMAWNSCENCFSTCIERLGNLLTIFSTSLSQSFQSNASQILFMQLRVLQPWRGVITFFSFCLDELLRDLDCRCRFLHRRLRLRRFLRILQRFLCWCCLNWSHRKAHAPKALNDAIDARRRSFHKRARSWTSHGEASQPSGMADKLSFNSCCLFYKDARRLVNGIPSIVWSGFKKVWVT